MGMTGMYKRRLLDTGSDCKTYFELSTFAYLMYTRKMDVIFVEICLYLNVRIDLT